jgi:hypothetical protein
VRTRSFVIGIVICAVVFIGIGVAISILNAGHHRPEGAAERWLAAVGDTTRKGVRDDAVERTEKIGPLSVAEPLLAGLDTDDKAAFPDLEVGKAVISGDTARVPYRLHQRDVDDAKVGTIVLTESGEVWKVGALDSRQAGEEVPSEGGAPPSSAPFGVWIVAVLAGVGVTAGASVLVEWAARSSRRELATGPA